jgi:hypothetical protein
MSEALAAVQSRNARIEVLEQQVATLESELSELKAAFDLFRQQFD